MQADDADDETCRRHIAEECDCDDRAAAMVAAGVLPLPDPGCGAAATVDPLKAQCCAALTPDGWLADAASTLLDVLIP